MADKHLIIIHGRATKPTEAEKKRLVMKALTAGLNRIDSDAAQQIADGQVKTTFVYYGDISNRILVNDKPELKEYMVEIDGNWFEPNGSYDKDLDRLLARETIHHAVADYKQLLANEEDNRALDDLARIASPVLSLFGLSKSVIPKMLPDLGAYLYSRTIGEGSTIRERLQAPLRQALLDGEDVAILSHSMGCIVAYDVLWKLSRMSEYKDVRDKKISLWMTLGNPLGEPAVRENLYDSNEPDDGQFPTNIKKWLNISAKDDFVAHDGDVADDFEGMTQCGLIDDIEDPDRIYTFWAGRDGSNPHKFYGYLNHPFVAKHLVAWINGRD